MNHSSLNQRPKWEKTAIYGAVVIALAATSGLALATPIPCAGVDPLVVSADMAVKCTPASTAVATLNSGVKIDVTAGSAVYYSGNLGDGEVGAYVGSLTNNGTIQSVGTTSNNASTYGLNVGVNVNGEIFGALTNNGTIKASTMYDGEGYSPEAIGIREGSQYYALQGTIDNTNTGAILVDAVNGSGGYADATGIYITNNVDPAGLIRNAGSITVNAESSDSAWVSTTAKGINVGNSVSGTISNSGTLSATATATTTGYAEGYVYATGIYANGVTQTGSVTNTGTVHATATVSTDGNDINVQARGVWVQNQVGKLTNSGVVEATATRSDAGYGYAVGVVSHNFGSSVENDPALINNTSTGVIRAIGNNGAEAIGVDVYAYYSNLKGSIENAGEITATAMGGGQASGVNVQANDSDISVTNSGTISAYADSADAYGFAGYAYADQTLHNSGTITGTAGPDNNGYSVSSYGFNIDNAATGKLIGSLYADGGEGYGVTVTNAGLIDLPLFMQNMRGRSIDQSSGYIGGDFTQVASGTLRVAADSATAGAYSQLFVTGTATLAGTLDVNVLNNGANLAVGNTLSGVVQAGAISGTFSKVTDNSALFNFVGHYYTTAEGDIYSTPRVDLEVVKGQTTEQVVRSEGNNPAAGSARAFDTIRDAGNGNASMQTVLGVMGNLNEKKLSDAVSQTLPLLTGGSMQAAGSALSGINRVVQARIESNRGLSSGDTFAGDKHMWLKPFGSRADQNDRNAVAGYKANTGGFAMGADGSLSDVTRAGVAFAYAKSDVTSNSSVAAQSADVDVYQLIGYGSYKLDERSELNFQVDIGQNKNDGQRSIGFMGTVAKARYDSQTAHAGLGWARTLTVNEQTSWTPSVRADYTWIKDASYSETGAGALNLNVAARHTEDLILGADVKLMHKLNEHTTLTANAGLGYDALNKQASVTATFAGAPGVAFVTNGLEQDPWMARVGFGLVHNTASGVEVSARYDLEYREGFNNQTVSMKARWAF